MIRPSRFPASIPIYRIQCPLLRRTKWSTDVSQAHKGTVYIEQYGAEQLEVHLHAHPLSHLPPVIQVTVKQHMESIGELAKATERWEEEHGPFWKGKSTWTYGSCERSWTSNLGRLEPGRNVAALPWSLFTINSWAPAQCFIWEQPPAFLHPCSVSLLHWHIYTRAGARAAVNKGPYIKRGKRDAKMNFMEYFPFFFDLVVRFATAHWALTQHLDTLLHAVSPLFLIVSTCQAKPSTWGGLQGNGD